MGGASYLLLDFGLEVDAFNKCSSLLADGPIKLPDAKELPTSKAGT